MNIYGGIASFEHDRDGFCQFFLVRANDVGPAVDLVEQSASRLGGRSWVASIDFDRRLPETALNEFAQDGDAPVWWHSTRYTYPVATPSFVWPRGVVACCWDEHGFDLELIRAGFARRPQGSNHGTQHLAVAAPRHELFDLFAAAVNLGDDPIVTGVVLEPETDSGTRQLLLNRSLDQRPALLNFLHTHKCDLFDNGQVTLICVRKTDSINVQLSSHKLIEIHSPRQNHLADYERVLQQLDLPQFDRLYAIDQEVHHWHYQPTGSRTRRELLQLLLASGFSDQA